MKKTMAIEKVKQMLTRCFTKCSEKYNQCAQSTKGCTCTKVFTKCLGICLAGCLSGFILTPVLTAIATFIMSIVYINDCELAPELPVCLIVEFSLHLLMVISLVLMFRKDRQYTSTFATVAGYCMLIIVPFLLFILYFGITMQIMTVQRTFYASGRCNNTATVSPFTVTSSWNLTTSPRYQIPVLLGTNGSFSANETIIQTSPGTSQCLSCNKHFVDFICGIYYVRLLNMLVVAVAVCGGKKTTLPNLD